MFPAIKLRDGTLYEVVYCQHFASLRVTAFADYLKQYIADNHGGLESFQAQTSRDTFEVLINLLMDLKIIIPGDYKTLFDKYTKAKKEEKTKLKNELDNLVGKLDKGVYELTEYEKKMFVNSISLFIPNAKAISPQRNYKRTSLSNLKDDDLKIKFPDSEGFEITLPQDLTLMEESINLLLKCQDSDDLQEKYLDELPPKIRAVIAENTNCNYEIIIVPDEWQSDTEICDAIAMRDKAHSKHQRHAVILTISELNSLEFHEISSDLKNVYKISTIMHPLDCSVEVSQQISDLASVCCTNDPCSLREITLRQCFSAGHRPAEHGESSYARVPDANEPSLEEKELLNIFFDPKKTPSSAEEMRKIKSRIMELQTRPVQTLLEGPFVDPESNLAKLASILTNNETLSKKVPDLLVKGYYGPVTPSPEGSQVTCMRPGRERASKDQQLPTRFYKGTRITLFKHEDDSTLPEMHQPKLTKDPKK